MATFIKFLCVLFVLSFVGKGKGFYQCKQSWKAFLLFKQKDDIIWKGTFCFIIWRHMNDLVFWMFLDVRIGHAIQCIAILLPYIIFTSSRYVFKKFYYVYFINVHVLVIHAFEFDLVFLICLCFFNCRKLSMHPKPSNHQTI